MIQFSNIRPLMRVVATLTLFVLFLSANAIAQGIYTSISDGTTVNANLYDSKADVYLNGGPQNQNGKGLPDGTYYFQVTDPSGNILLSTDPASCRQLQVVDRKSVV